ncbi:MAG TPA: PAS domain S-box protein [Pyrinomonadaceae bacterium]|nr:PAS domain S-box protein [Pyrinomonadaceae bacterium]
MIKILIIDLAAESPSSVRTFLSAQGVTGFDVAYAISYGTILEAFRDKSYDVCLIDSSSGNALKLVAQAQIFGCTAPIIVVTSNEATEVIRAIRGGAADCLIRDSLTAARIERSICWVFEQARASSLQKGRERRYLALMENADEMIATHDLEGNFTSINRAGERLIGYSQEEILTRNIFQIVAPQNRELLKKTIRQTLDARKLTLEEIDLVTISGKNLRVEVSAHLIYQEGNPIEVQITARAPRANARLDIPPPRFTKTSPLPSGIQFNLREPHDRQRVVRML